MVYLKLEYVCVTSSDKSHRSTGGEATSRVLQQLVVEFQLGGKFSVARPRRRSVKIDRRRQEGKRRLKSGYRVAICSYL